jgi:DNA-binding transcriptional LysR family regulator
MERGQIDLVDITAFLRVAETGSFARAAERLGLAKSIVSRRVSRLEERLGARLLTRSSKGAQPTDIGETYFARVSRSLADLEAAQEEVAIAVAEIAGPIRLTGPLSFGAAYLAPALAAFADLHPRVELDISFEDRAVDLIAGGFDLAIRIGNLPDSSLTARRLAPVRSAVLASPEYLARRGRPQHPRDLAGHDAILYANAGAAEQWRFRTGNAWERVRVTGRLRADNGEMLRAAACAGLGVVILPTFIASPAIESGALEIILADYPLEEAGLHAVMPPGRGATARVRALVAFLAERFGPEPAWDPCWGKSAPLVDGSRALP